MGRLQNNYSADSCPHLDQLGHPSDANRDLEGVALLGEERCAEGEGGGRLEGGEVGKDMASNFRRRIFIVFTADFENEGGVLEFFCGGED